MAIPTPSAVAASKRYIAPGTRKFVWVVTIANKNAPTSAEITAGKDLSSEVNDASGWTVTTNNVDTPDFGNRFTTKVPGMITADDSSFTFYNDRLGVDIRTLLLRDVSGFVCVFPEGIAAGLTLDVFPVTISSVPKQQSASDPAHIVVNFAITGVPAENVAVPTV